MLFRDWFPESIRSASTVLPLRVGETLFRHGSSVVGFYEVLSGRVRLARPTVTGHHVSLYVARAGDFLAEPSLFNDAYHCEATALIRSVVRLYPKDAVLAEFESKGDFAKGYAAMLASSLMAVRVRNERLILHGARDRIWHFLALNAGADDRSVTVKGPLKDLAAELGLTHEVLYRTLARMEDEGEIRRRDNVIQLINI